MQIVSNVALISINETLLFQLLSFLIFLFIINRVMFRPLRETMRERESYVKKVNQDILDAKEALESIIEQTKIEEDAVRYAAFKVSETLEKSANKEAGDIMDAARSEIAVLSEQSRKAVNIQLANVRKSIGNEAETLALMVMEKILERKVTE
jgi:F-type H+-transporting ATPase subunit b